MLGCVDIGANEMNTGGSIDCCSAGAGEQRQMCLSLASPEMRFRHPAHETSRFAEDVGPSDTLIV